MVDLVTVDSSQQQNTFDGLKVEDDLPQMIVS